MTYAPRLLQTFAIATALAGMLPAPLTAQTYAERVTAIEAERNRLAAAYRGAKTEAARSAVLAETNLVLTRALADQLFPPWYGTPWAFYGTSESPGQGSIACGYFVSTLLRDAGFALPRRRLAQQPAENIIRSLVPAGWIWRFSDKPVDDVLDHVHAEGDGLYLIGLDYHVGFLLKQGARLDMCHSSVLEPGAVVCEPAAEAEAMESRYRVLGKLFAKQTLRSWLERRPIRIRRR